MSTTVVLLVAALAGGVGSVARAVAAVRRERLRWTFYRHVYDQGGQVDLKAAAEVLEARDDDDGS